MVILLSLYSCFVIDEVYSPDKESPYDVVDEMRHNKYVVIYLLW